MKWPAQAGGSLLQVLRQIDITDVSARRLLIVDGDGRVQAAPISIVGHDLAVRPASAELWITPWNDARAVVVDHVRVAGGRVYVAVGPGELVVLDAASRSVLARRAVGPGVHDVGLGRAIN